jgi:hypothetical protein
MGHKAVCRLTQEILQAFQESAKEHRSSKEQASGH